MKVQVENAQQNEQVDWSKNPQLVCCIDTIVLVAENQGNTFSREEFSGIDVKSGKMIYDWNKHAFKPFHGKITLQND